MPLHRHIFVEEAGRQLAYTSTRTGGGEFRIPPRERRVHAGRLLADLQHANVSASGVAQQTGHMLHNICLEIVGEQGYELKVESLQDLRYASIEVLSVKRVNNQSLATIYVPEGKLAYFVRKIERYAAENNRRSGRPKNEDLVAGISRIRFPVLESFWTDDDDLFPSTNNERIWWEVWIRESSAEDADTAFGSFIETVAESDIRVSPHAIKFPERLVFLAFASCNDWIQAFVPLLDRIAELRKAKEVPSDFLRLSPREQRGFVEDVVGRMQLPSGDAPRVCLLDHGIHAAHPLLNPVIGQNGLHVYDPDWAAVDNRQTHGTEMAGLVLFGDELPQVLASDQPVLVTHRLESVRMLNNEQPHPDDTWGYVTQNSLAKAESASPQVRRVACLPVTADDEGRDHGRPSSWSGAIDQHAAGQMDDVKRLYVVSAGNVRDVVTNEDYAYPETNFRSGIEDPAQSWNALTVGACTSRIHIVSDGFEGYRALALPGGLCPTSRTSHDWTDRAWPIKPDIVMEGGNYVTSPEGRIDGCEDLSLLTTCLDPAGRLLTWASDTSAATAQATRLAAILMADYPELWPETVRGLLVHSAEWTDEMNRQIPGSREEDRHRRLRCFGYGVPSLERARYTVENSVSLVHQGAIQPFRCDGSEVKTNHFVLHSLPWPEESLRELHDQDVTVKITLSYFIEPSPAGRGWGKKFRYASHGLRFALRGPTETEMQFRQRVSRQEWEEEEGQPFDRPPTSDPINWTIGMRLRTRGSVHSDWWTAPAADVAQCGQVAVFPVTGWWRERKHLGSAEKHSRYALIITLSTAATGIDLYTPIAQQVGIVTDIST